MKQLYIAIILATTLNSSFIAKAQDSILGTIPIVSNESRKTLNLYRAEREVTKVEEGRLFFKNSSQGDFIQEKPSFKFVVFDRTDHQRWRIELHANDDTDLTRDPAVSIYSTTRNRSSLIENVFESEIKRTSPHGPAWHSLKVIETKDGYIFELTDSPDRWDGKIGMKWICKKGYFAEPTHKTTETERVILIDFDVDE